MADPATTEMLLGLPTTMWQGIVTACATLLGAAVGIIGTNLGNSNRLQRQLDHDTSEKAKERLLALRRELYLKAVDANARGLAYFGSLPQADFTKPDADVPIRNLLAISSQLLLVVNQGTAQFVSDVMSEYGELQLKLVAKVMPMHSVRSNIEIQNTLHENAQLEIKRILTLMTQYNESGQRDAAQFERLNRSFQSARDVSQEVAKKRSSLWDQMNALHRQYIKDLAPETKRLAQIQMHLLVELRRELDVGGDIEIFKRIVQKQIERMERALAEFDKNIYGPDDTDEPPTNT